MGKTTFQFTWSYLPLVLEILIAEMLFLYPFKRKKYFLLRYFGVFLLCCFYCNFYLNVYFPIENGLQAVLGETIGTSLNSFIMYFSLMAFTVLGMFLCFRGAPWAIISACSAGYAVQHFAFKFYDILRAVFSLNAFWDEDASLYTLLFETICHAVIYVAAYFAFARVAKKNDFKNTGDPLLNILSFAIVLICIGINRFASDFSDRTTMQVVADSLYAMVCCLFALVIQFSLFERIKRRNEIETDKQIIKEQARQYEQWKTGLDAINMRYHDLKHEIQAVKDRLGGDFGRVEALLSDYGATVRTGNEMLDVLLTGKKMVCDRKKISFTCMTEEGLERLSGREAFSLFCNAIDNAIEATEKIETPEKRVISLVVSAMGSFLSVRLQNYFEGEIVFENDLPITQNEEEGHGYGVRSMKRTAEELGGAMSVSLEDDVFTLELILPIQ